MEGTGIQRVEVPLAVELCHLAEDREAIAGVIAHVQQTEHGTQEDTSVCRLNSLLIHL